MLFDLATAYRVPPVLLSIHLFVLVDNINGCTLTRFSQASACLNDLFFVCLSVPQQHGEPDQEGEKWPGDK